MIEIYMFLWGVPMFLNCTLSVCCTRYREYSKEDFILTFWLSLVPVLNYLLTIFLIKELAQFPDWIKGINNLLGKLHNSIAGKKK